MSYNPYTNLNKFDKYAFDDRMRGMFGDHETYIDPYTTGYHFIFFTKLPTALHTMGVGSFLTTTAQSVNIPGISVNNIVYNGLNNLKWKVPGTVEYDRDSISIKFTEFMGLPITQIMGSWITIFRNMTYGVADPEINQTTPYSQGAYKGKIIYATCLPDGHTVQFASAFSGVYPTKIPTDNFSSDRSSHDKVEPDIDFSFDMMYTGEQVRVNAQALVNCTYNHSIVAVDDMYLEAASVNGECG